MDQLTIEGIKRLKILNEQLSSELKKIRESYEKLRDEYGRLSEESGELSHKYETLNQQYSKLNEEKKVLERKSLVNYEHPSYRGFDSGYCVGLLVIDALLEEEGDHSTSCTSS